MVAVGPTTVNRGGPFDRPFESLRTGSGRTGWGLTGPSISLWANGPAPLFLTAGAPRNAVNRGGPFDRLRANGLGFDGSFDFPQGERPRPSPILDAPAGAV